MSNSDKSGSLRGVWTQVFASTTGTLFSISDGICYGWTAPVIPYLISEKSHIKTTLASAEWLETVMMIGSFCALPFTILVINKIGCKKSQILATAMSLLAWICIMAANRMWHLYIARFLLGAAANMSFVSAPMYIAEIADQKIRGFLTSISYLMIMVGFIIVYSVAPFTQFYVIPLISTVILTIELVTFSFMPESPYHHLKHGRPEQASKALEYFRPGRDCFKELEEITHSLERQSKERGRMRDLFLVHSNRKPLIILTVLNGGQHMTGLSVILMNLHLILESAGSIYMTANKVAIVYSVIMLIAANIASLQIDRYGRKALLIFSSITTGLCLLALAVYFHLKQDGYDVSGASWIPVAAVLMYAFTFKVGLGIVPIIITAEVFSSKLKAFGMTMADAMFIIGGILAINLYQRLAAAFGMALPFYVFTICSFSIAIFTHIYIPETKGKTLEEIQMMLKGKKFHQEKPREEEITKLEAI